MPPVVFHDKKKKRTDRKKLESGPAMAILNSALGIRRFTFHLRNAAENKEGNAFDGYLISLGDKGVGEFMECYRGKKQ